ncbi:hypothetical protein BKA65DRAFT_491164 [Rhexocercosporidium sp. MPI-PUGE-AT-0058]|nr:hypothetical protein BKA65DRAFT_491164 [Rhexocercosporidium sp. MPI-PUGE-AT-0058]
MKAFMNIGLAASLANLSLASLTTHNPLNGLKPKRALLTCLETYGGGSMTCGGIDSLFCYDPTVGEVSSSRVKPTCRTISNILNRLAAPWTTATAKLGISALRSQDSAAQS